jgi:hypothetical protein
MQWTFCLGHSSTVALESLTAHRAQICRSGAAADDRRDTDPVFAFVDPTPLIDERIAAEIGPLVEALSHATDVRERRRLMREIRRRAHVVRESLSNPLICW